MPAVHCRCNSFGAVPIQSNVKNKLAEFGEATRVSTILWHQDICCKKRRRREGRRTKEARKNEGRTEEGHKKQDGGKEKKERRKKKEARKDEGRMKRTDTRFNHSCLRPIGDYVGLCRTTQYRCCNSSKATLSDPVEKRMCLSKSELAGDVEAHATEGKHTNM